MNNRLKELDKQAKLWAIDNTNFPISSHIPAGYTEKLAELIALECMNICEERRAVYFGKRLASDVFIDKNMYAEGEATCEAIRYNIKHRFGVEE